MKIITCAGYYRTGSSAVTDFFTEFENCESLGDYEFRFAQEPDGISDLEYHIVDSNHRHNTSNAIKRFLKYSKFENGHFWDKRYQKFFGKHYMELTNEYVKDITKLITESKWRYDKIERGELFYQIDRLYSKLYGMIHKNRRASLLTLKGELGYFTDITREEFYAATKKYTSALLSIANKNNAEFMMVDQLASPSNVDRYFNYFDDLLVVVVDRDPRDIFVLENKIYRWKTIPHDDVKDFCEWYRITRSHRSKEHYEDNPRVQFVRFEDLIYNYEETTKRLMNFVGLDESLHTRPFTKLIPEQSAKGTKTWLNYPDLKEEIAYIEKELPEYIYNYND